MTDDTDETSFTLHVRHEGYHADQFTPHTQINRFYLVGSGTPSAERLVETHLYAIADAVIGDKHSLSDVLLRGIITDIGNPLDIQVVDKETYADHDGATTFGPHLIQRGSPAVHGGRESRHEQHPTAKHYANQLPNLYKYIAPHVMCRWSFNVPLS
ncbi:hypothetical protein J2751_002717 [Halorubrum alkaliphilum]|uniref:Uncharacterized protein n=1 Tax=Halorubrum alkaliphilum TaxID=261290 RepID=A0A8T4GKZ0_9EURY|nr:hypothetical protein [Halorubrum alkaliphilum]MBP1923672.1 hypothetical protein [Halorubrum alkaliphilum]